MVYLRITGLSRLNDVSHIALVAAALTVIPVSAASAQDAPTPAAETPEQVEQTIDPSSSGVSDIVVTAQKRSENLQNVPISVTAVSSEQLQAVGVVDTRGLTAVTSGLSIGAAAGNFSPHIRGVGTTAYGIGIESPVALYIDGVYYGAQPTGFVNLVDVAQVTVLKGPQGTLFGRNATGGVIQLTTRDPEERFGGELRTELDNYATLHSNLYVTGPITDNVKANLSLSYGTQGDGWGKNIQTGNDNHKLNHEYSARAKILFEPGPNTDIKLNFDYVDRSDSLNGNLVPAPGTTPLAPGFRRTSNIYDTDSSVDPKTILKSGGGSLEINQNFGQARLVSITALRAYKFDAFFDPSLSPVPQLVQRVFFKGTQFSQELQLISSNGGWFNWITGAYYFHAKDKEPAVDQINSNLFSQIVYHSPNARIFQTGTGTTKSFAVFGQATAELMTDTKLTIGLRYTTETRKLEGQILAAFYDASAGQSPNLFPAFPALDAKTKANKLTWRLALDHKFTPDILGYASYNRGFKSGGFNGFNPTPFNPPYRPEVVDTYEAGLKTVLFDRRLRFNVSGFYNKYSDIQIIQFISLPFLSNAAKAVTYGVDVDIEARLTDELRLNGGLELLHTEFKGNSVGIVTRFVGEPGGQTISTEGSIAGNRLAFAPKITYNLGATYSKELDSGRIDLNVNDAYSSSYFLSESNFLAQKSYHLLSTSLTWTSSDDRVSLSLWGRNLLDKAVATFLTNGALGYSLDIANPPRTFGGTVTLRFGT